MTALQENSHQFNNQLEQWKQEYSDVVNDEHSWLDSPGWLDSPTKADIPPAEPINIPHASTHPSSMRRIASESSFRRLQRRKRTPSFREDSYFDLSSRNHSYVSLASSALDDEYFAGCEEEELT